MFYFNADDPSIKACFQLAIETIKETFYSVYASDNLIALGKTSGFLKDKKFMDSFEKYASSDQEKSLTWRLHVLIWATKHCLNIPGDFVECGVFKGFSSAVIADYHDFNKIIKTMYLYDTFEGVPDEYKEHDTQNDYYNDMNIVDNETVYKNVLRRFDIYNNVIVTKGALPHSLTKVCPAEISFLHIDLNSAEAENAVLEVLFDKISPGGIIILDDYGWLFYEKQKILEDEFFNKRNHSVLELPTGQGLVIKQN